MAQSTVIMALLLFLSLTFGAIKADGFFDGLFNAINGFLGSDTDEMGNYSVVVGNETNLTDISYINYTEPSNDDSLSDLFASLDGDDESMDAMNNSNSSYDDSSETDSYSIFAPKALTNNKVRMIDDEDTINGRRPTQKPTKKQRPTPRPTKKTRRPTKQRPTPRPTRKTPKPTRNPKPSKRPTPRPTKKTKRPTPKPTKQRPTPRPTKRTRRPTPKPTKKTRRPTPKPTKRPTPRPTKKTRRPTPKPTRKPTKKPTKRPTKRPTAPARFEDVCIGQETLRGFEFLTESKSLVLERGVIECREWEIQKEHGFDCGKFECYSIKLLPDNLYLGKDIIDGVLSFNLRRSEIWIIGEAGRFTEDLWALKHYESNQFLCARDDVGIGMEGQVFFRRNGDNSGCHWKFD